MIENAFNRLRYLYEFWRFHGVHLRSRNGIERWQRARLVELIAYISANIPLYAKLLAEAATEVAAIREIKDLRLLPIMKRSHFIGVSVDEYTDASSPISGSWTTTSGSSGIPFSPLRRRIAHMPLYRDSLRYRSVMDERWSWVTLDHVRVVHFLIFPVRRENHFVVPVSDVLNFPERALEETMLRAPDIIESYPSAIFEFARYLNLTHTDFTVPYVITVGERMSLALRRAIEQTLKCKLFDRYGLEEFGTVAMECDMHDGYHVNVESFIIEIVNERGETVPEGESGRVLITDLYNFQMPFVRYETGDRGRVSWKRCACGLDAMRIWVDGRDSSVITLSIGARKYHHFEFSESLKSFMNHIMQFQIEKQSEDSIVVRIVPGPFFDDTTEAAVKRKLIELVGETAVVSIERVSRIKLLPRGKIQVIVDSTAH